MSKPNFKLDVPRALSLLNINNISCNSVHQVRLAVSRRVQSISVYFSYLSVAGVFEKFGIDRWIQINTHNEKGP